MLIAAIRSRCRLDPHEHLVQNLDTSGEANSVRLCLAPMLAFALEVFADGREFRAQLLAGLQRLRPLGLQGVMFLRQTLQLIELQSQSPQVAVGMLESFPLLPQLFRLPRILAIEMHQLVILARQRFIGLAQLDL